MSLSISYACTDSATSTGRGFDTQNAMSGSTTTVITAPPPGYTTGNYQLTCTNQNLTASAQCAVEINQPSIVLIANPSVVPYNTPTAVGWVTTGMQACTISSPEMPDFTARNAQNQSINGIATTSPITGPVNVRLHCTTLNAGVRDATTTLTVGTTANTNAVTVSGDADGKTIARGGTMRISWNSISPPAGSAMGLWLVRRDTGAVVAVIKGGLAQNGIYNWTLPSTLGTCNAEASNVCSSDLKSGVSYSIQAALYTPSNAYIGDNVAPTNPISPTYGSVGMGGVFTIQ
jgi:hypothetical protein